MDTEFELLCDALNLTDCTSRGCGVDIEKLSELTNKLDRISEALHEMIFRATTKPEDLL